MVIVFLASTSRLFFLLVRFINMLPQSVTILSDDKSLDVLENMEGYQVLEKRFRVYVQIVPEKVNFIATSTGRRHYINGNKEGQMLLPSQYPETQNLFIGFQGEN